MTGEENILKLVDAEPPPAPYRLQDQVGFLLRKAHQRHVAIFAAGIADLTPPQFAVLATLDAQGDTSQNQLGTLVAMDAATVKGVVDRLAARGLLRGMRHEGDKRRLMLGLTPEGEALVGSLVPSALRITADTLSPLSDKEAQVLTRLLAKLG